jgi:hypothetical protein
LTERDRITEILGKSTGKRNQPKDSPRRREEREEEKNILTTDGDGSKNLTGMNRMDRIKEIEFSYPANHVHRV